MAKRIKIEEIEIAIVSRGDHDLISLTDMTRNQLQEIVIIKWLSLKSTIEYLGEWEALYNPDFNYTEFGTIKNEAGSNNFVLSVKHWIEATKAIGITAKAGRYGGTYAHKDIAFHFGMWISPKFQLLLVKEYQRLKETIIPKLVGKNETSLVYANEADLLNVALFGKSAQQWRAENPDSKGNIRDEATIEQLVVLSNLESMNAVFIHNGLSQPERLIQLNQMAITQMKSLLQHATAKKLE